MNKLQVVVFGPQKTPSYYVENSISGRPNESARWYKICYGTCLRPGDGYRAPFEWQCAYMCPSNMEVYHVHDFEEIEKGQIFDRNLIELEDWVYEHCFGLREIIDEEE